MIPIANHLWQSTVFAAAAGLLAFSLRRYGAQTRHWIWLAASLKFLVPFSLLTNLGSLLPRGETPILPRAAELVREYGQPYLAPVFTSNLPAAVREPESILPGLLLAAWLCGAAAILSVWMVRWYRIRTAVRTAEPYPIEAPVRVLSSPAMIEPGVFGIFQPVLLLPQGIADRLSPAQLRAVLAHELSHVRRRDNLAAAIQMAVEATFWFHPLVWFIGARMVDERERACDEEVLRQGSEPEVYAEGILNVCKFYLQSPLPCAAGVSGADLRKRIEAIMSNRIFPALTLPRRVFILAAATAAVAGPIFIGMWNAPRSLAQSQEKLVFEVASIKRLDPAAQGGGPRPLAPGVMLGGGIRSQVSIFNLMCWAYRIDGAQLSGGPAWVRSDLYDIQAKAEKFEGPDDPTVPISEQQANRTRERVKALLADRFQLAVRSESKEAPVFILSVVKGGHKLTLVPERRGGVSRGAGVIESPGAPISFLAVPLTQMLGRPVLDETGLDGMFKYKLEYRPVDPQEIRGLALLGHPLADDDPRPSIFTAIKDQLGLELQTRKGPVAAVVIERIERPTEN